MESKVGVSILPLMSICWFADAGHLIPHDVSGYQKDGQLCGICERFTAQTISYLSENKTQTDIIVYLHQTCMELPILLQECIPLVDYYASMFFFEITSIKPDDLCAKANLYGAALFVSQKRLDSCEFCHQSTCEVLVKLKDPEIQMDIIEVLLKGCDRIEKYAIRRRDNPT